MDKIEVVISASEKDLGGFTVRRILPYSHCMVGPFIFFDHLGPAVFSPGDGIDVRPHPHICLATVTYLFEGQIRHRDSLGSDQLIKPGDINWMVAGKGIVHSERTPKEDRIKGARVHGIQCWVALPVADEEIAPSFSHYPVATLPEFIVEGATIKLLVGTAFEHSSPVCVNSEMFYIHAKIPKGVALNLPFTEEQAVYVLSGHIKANDENVKQHAMAIVNQDNRLKIIALEDSEVMFLGGKPLGQRYIYWNFVASSKEKIEIAKKIWAQGPGELGDKFPKIPGDQQDFIPLPVVINEQLEPKGTIL